MASTINAKTTGVGGIDASGDASGVLALQTGGTTALTIDASQNVTLANTLNVPNTFGFKNRIINGGMVIDQRNAGASSTGNGYTVDRFAYFGAAASKGTWQQNAGSVTPPTGFKNYLGFTSSSAYSVGAAEQFNFYQPIEGFNVSDLGWGATGAATVTLSFWVRSSLTGTFGGAIYNSAVNRSYPFSYTISSANTWEQKTVTIAGDMSGTWLTTNGIGLYVNFSLGAGSTVSGTAGAWTTGRYDSVTGATSVVGTSGATFYITGVQLEKGSVATSFDQRAYSQELAMCQRYYQGGNTAIWRGLASLLGNYFYWMPFNTIMRTSPTMSVGSITYSNSNSAAFFNASACGAEFTFTVSVATGYAFVTWTASAEL